MSYFAEKLKNLRLQRGLTQAVLASELDVSQNAVFNWENGKREPSIEMIQKIADYFQVSTAYLFAEKEIYQEMLRFLDEFSMGKVPGDADSVPASGDGSAAALPESVRESPSDFVIMGEDGKPFAAIEFMRAAQSHASLIAYARKYYEWYQKTCAPLNEDGQSRVAEYAELLSASERYQKKRE